MPKQRRAAAGRSMARPAARKSSAKTPKVLKLSKAAKVSKPSARAKNSKAVKPANKTKPSIRASAALGVRPIAAKEPAPKEVAVPPPPPRRPAFYEALAVYETGVRALQRHDFEAAADSLRGVIQRYPGERELVERARLYLQVCERETARRPSGPQTPSESVYAATVALNAGDVEGALSHLNRALERAPESDHAHYIMAVALVDKGDPSRALVHLRQAVTLNPDNRSVALQDPDLSALHDLDAFRQVLGTADGSIRRRVKARR
jgi:tetratricopeptide (TPR) repeat protein